MVISTYIVRYRRHALLTMLVIDNELGAMFNGDMMRWGGTEVDGWFDGQLKWAEKWYAGTETDFIRLP